MYRKITILALSTIVFLVLVGAASAQMVSMARPLPPAEIPTAFPFDLTDEYYEEMGISPKLIIDRKTGFDGLSVPDKSGDPRFSDVRIIVTIPAYNQYGGTAFWYPLGDLPFDGFLDTKMGDAARRTAALHPIYTFPDRSVAEAGGYGTARQSPIIPNMTSTFSSRLPNPLGLRQIFKVTYTEKAFEKDAFEIMSYMMKMNGAAADETPIIRTLDDLEIQKRIFVADD